MAKTTFRQQARENPIRFLLMMVVVYLLRFGYEFLRPGRAQALARRAPRDWARRMALQMLLIVPLEAWFSPRIVRYVPEGTRGGAGPRPDVPGALEAHRAQDGGQNLT